MQSLTALTNTGRPHPHAASSTHDADAAQVVRRHLRGVFQFARALGADRELAADLTQDAFAVAWQKNKSKLPDAALGSFLRRTVRNRWLHHSRSRRRQEAAIAAATEQLWLQDRNGDRDARIDATHACMQQLSPRAKRAIQLRYRDDLGREAIARALDMAPNGVKTLLARTRRWLQQCIESTQP